MGLSQFQITMKLLSFLSIIALGIWDFISSILYFYQTSFSSKALSHAFLLFIFLSLIFQLFSWSSIVLKVRYNDTNKDIKNDLLGATNTLHILCLVVTAKIKVFFRKSLCLILNLPLIIFVAVSQKIKLFPIILFSYTFFKYKAVLTTDLMRSLAIIMY